MNVQQDKLMHYFVGTLLALVLVPFIGFYSMILVASIAVAKELYDYYSGKGTPELLDIVWTVLGGLVVVISYLIGTVI